jgi:uncharacterized protein (UPF0548 family)
LGKTQIMSIRLKPPSNDALRALIDAGQSDSLTYEPVGLSTLASPPAGYRRGRWSCQLGRGDRVFERAANALREWRVQTGAGLIVLADGPPSVGLIVAIAAPLPIGYIDVVCRVVDVVDRPDCYSFTYGTLSVHPEQGEESFTVTRAPDDQIIFEIVAVSRARLLASRACPPVARRLQRAATMRYLDAMHTAVRAAE